MNKKVYMQVRLTQRIKFSSASQEPGTETALLVRVDGSEACWLACNDSIVKYKVQAPPDYAGLVWR